MVELTFRLINEYIVSDKSSFAPEEKLCTYPTVEFEGVVRSDFRTLRDQICTAHGLAVMSVRQVDF